MFRMSAPVQAKEPKKLNGKALKNAVDLFSQQLWCWGRDILRPEGNWLLEVGFQRTKVPEDRENCVSMYSRELPGGQRVVLRGFGVFYGDDALGSIFLARYAFQPEYTTLPKLECPPWSTDDLPKMGKPSESQQEACGILTQALINWIHQYEVTIVDRLGIEYRRSTLETWNNGKRPFIEAEDMTTAWSELSQLIATP